MTETQRKQLVGTLQLGCPMETATEFAGVEQQDVHAEMLSNPTFTKEVLQSQATPEIVHMRGVREAAKDVKNWRASVWWLERCLPQKYGRRQPGTVTEDEFEKFIAELVELVDSEVRDRHDQQRLIEKINGMQARQSLVESEDDLETEEMPT